MGTPDKASATATMTRSPPDKTHGARKAMQICKRKTAIVGDEIARLQEQNAELAGRAEVERSLAEELGGIVAKMKAEIASESRVCDRLRRDLLQTEKRCSQLRLKADTIVSLRCKITP